MQTIVRDQAKKYAFDWRDEPLLRVSEGETIAIETWDASTGFSKRRKIKLFRRNGQGLIAPRRWLTQLPGLFL